MPVRQHSCPACFTFTFVTETKFEGCADGSIIIFDLALIGQYCQTYIGLPQWEDKFINGLLNTKSFSATSTELRIINEVENYYLLFKRVEP